MKLKMLLFAALYLPLSLASNKSSTLPLQNVKYTTPTPEAIKKDIKFELYNKTNQPITAWMWIGGAYDSDSKPQTKFDIDPGNVYQIKEDVFEGKYKPNKKTKVPELYLKLYFTKSGSNLGSQVYLKYEDTPEKKKKWEECLKSSNSCQKLYQELYYDQPIGQKDLKLCKVKGYTCREVVAYRGDDTKYAEIRNITKDDKIYIEYYTKSFHPYIKPRTGRSWGKTGFTHSDLPLDHNIGLEKIAEGKEKIW